MPQRGGSYFHLHLVSDATGETLITVARAATAQYASVSPVEHMHPLVRSSKQLDRVLNEIETAPGIVLYTLLELELAERLEKTCRDLGLPCLSILGPVLGLFQKSLRDWQAQWRADLGRDAVWNESGPRKRVRVHAQQRVGRQKFLRPHCRNSSV